MLGERKDKKKIILIITCIVLMQCIMLFYWQNQRGNFYNDELYSFGYASSFLMDKSNYITEDPVWEYGTWIPSEELSGKLKVDSSESLLTLPLGRQISLLLRKRTFMGLLNILMSRVGYEATFYQYAWHVLYMNILFYLIAELLLAYCVRKLTDNDTIAVLSIIMFGFSGIMMGMCEYVRFYMLTIMFLLVFICCHIKMWKESMMIRFVGIELLALISAYYALKHSELMLVTCGSFAFFYFVGLLFCRKGRLAFAYAVPLLLGMYRYVYLKTKLLDIVMHPAHYADPQQSGAAIIAYYFLSCTPERALESWHYIKADFCEKWFGCGQILTAFILLIIITAVYAFIYNKKAIADKNEQDKNAGVVIIIFLAALTSLIFNLLTNLNAERYNSFMMLLLMIVLWYCISRLEKVFDKSKFIIIVAMLTIIGAVFCQQPDRFTYLYINEKPMREILTEHQDKDRVMFAGGDNGFYDHYLEMHVAYESLVSVRDNTRVFVVAPGQENDLKKAKQMPDEFVAWHPIVGGSEEMKNVLNKMRYDASLLGVTHKSEIYLCKKQ